MNGLPENEINSDVSKFIEELAKVDDEKKLVEHDLIQVNGIAGNIYFVYEKIRNVVEYKEQSLFRKGAIARFLKRKFRFSHKFDPLAHELIVELTKTRYLINDTIGACEVSTIDSLLYDYISLYHQAIVRIPIRLREKIFNEILEIAACDIERNLVPRKRDEMYSDFVFGNYLKRSDVSKIASYNEKAFAIGLYSAIHRSLYRSDTGMIKSGLFLSTFKNWNKDTESIAETAGSYYGYSKLVSANIEGKSSVNILKVVRKTIAPYIVFRQIVLNNDLGGDYFLQESKIIHQIEKVCEAQYLKARQALGNSVLRSVLFIFLTKMLFAVLIEVPYDLFTSEHLNILPLALNLTFPPIYLILVGLSIRVPDSRNTKKIINDIRLLLYKNPEAELKYVFKDHANDSSWMAGFFNFLYALTFIISTGLMIALFVALKFNIVDSIVFFVFLSTVSFFGFRITKSAKELVTVDQKRSFTYVFFDFLYTPFITIGQWLSDKYSKINFLSFFLDFIIEAPLKTILHVFDQWTTFIKDKKDDLVQ